LADQSTKSRKEKLCHTLIAEMDEQFRAEFQKFGVTSIIDVLRIVLDSDLAFRNTFCEEFGIPENAKIAAPLSVLESLLLKDESMISLGIYDRIQKTISSATGKLFLYFSKKIRICPEPNTGSAS